MKILLNLLFLVLVFLAAMLLASGIKYPTSNVHEYKPKSEESSCSMPMCESLGGHDAIALQVMFGD